MGKEGALAMVKAAVSQGVSAWACAAVMRGWMAWSAGREAAEEAAAPYRWETRVRSLLRWRRWVGLWRSGQECQAPLAASTKLAVDVQTERCCTVLGGRWQFLPMATMHMAVWWASASGTEERPSSKDSVSREIGAGPAWKRVFQSDGGGAGGCGGWGRGGSRDGGCGALGGAGAGAGAGTSGAAGGSSACGCARRAAAVMAVEMLGVRIEPSSFRWFNSVYHRWADRGQGAGTRTWGLAGSKTQLRGGQAS